MTIASAARPTVPPLKKKHVKSQVKMKKKKKKHCNMGR